MSGILNILSHVEFTDVENVDAAGLLEPPINVEAGGDVGGDEAGLLVSFCLVAVPLVHVNVG